ncbi:MAG TPA: ABC transporter substrate-binding protein [Candidatus Limnocylindria bacterium]|nr:ABC transporter substrate-binding protein [Candidatus Limnocylindria bacterium]
MFVVSLLSACATPPPARKDVVLGLVGEPASIFADDPAARVLAAAVTEPLVAVDAHGDFVARLAVDVPTIENGGLRIVTDDPAAPGGRLVATFRLRDDAVWQDGEPITAQDVRFAHDQDASAPIGSTARWLADRIDAVDVVDDHYVRVAYRADERWDGYPIAPRVLPRHLLAGADAARRARYEREPVHAGPFSVAAWLPGYGVTLAAFPRHAGGAPALGRIEVRFYPDRNAVLGALRRGDVDVAPSPDLEADLTRLDRFADTNRLDVYYTAVEALEVLRFATHGPFADRAVRKAVELTVDRQGIVDDIFAGRARVPRTYLVPPLWATAETAPVARPDRDAARALLADAGFRKGNFGILERDGVRMTATLLVEAGSPARIDAARRVAGDLAAVGIAIDVRALPASEIAQLVATGDFDLALVAVAADDPARATDLWTRLVDPWFDVLGAAAMRAGTRDEKRQLYAELQRAWSDALPALPLYQRLRVDIATRALTGIEAPPDDGPLTWNVAAWRYAAP